MPPRPPAVKPGKEKTAGGFFRRQRDLRQGPLTSSNLRSFAGNKRREQRFVPVGVSAEPRGREAGTWETPEQKQNFSAPPRFSVHCTHTGVRELCQAPEVQRVGQEASAREAPVASRGDGCVTRTFPSNLVRSRVDVGSPQRSRLTWASRADVLAES